jgi:Tfp pilus assembly protein PilX
MTTHVISRARERGIAIVLAMFMMLAMSILGTSLMFISQTETLSSHNYRLMSQARYGAESGVHKAANYLLSTGYGAVMPGTAGDPLTNYVLTTSPVRRASNNSPVVLSWNSSDSNYPVNGVKTAFAAAATGSLDVNDAPVTYKAVATLKSMKQFHDDFADLDVTIQTWDIVSEGTISGARTATVEVTSTLERQTSAIYSYAAFATDTGCGAMNFGGGGFTDSYDSTSPLVNGVPVTAQNTGNVGTNGNLTIAGNTQTGGGGNGNGNTTTTSGTVINGTLSTPRTGVGTCTSGNVTAETINGQAQVTGGLVRLAQTVVFPTPNLPAILPPTSGNVQFQGSCPSGLPSGACSMRTYNINGTNITAPELDPSTQTSTGNVLVLGNVSVNATSTLFLKGGDYTFNSVTMNGNSKIVVVPGTGDVRINVVGKESNGSEMTTPITITGQGLVNTSYKPTDLQFIYAGTGEIRLAGGDTTSALFYAPNATGRFSGGADLYGAVVVKYLTDLGGAGVHYDRHLNQTAMTAGNYMLSAFTWRNY